MSFITRILMPLINRAACLSSLVTWKPGALQIIASALLAMLCTSCANLAGPEYTQPVTPGKQEWSNAESEVSPSTAAIEPDWWKHFGDPDLNKLIDRALSEGIDIRILAARIEVARAGVSQAEAGALPTVSAIGGVDRFSHSQAENTTRYSLAAEANWELDIWGKIRKGVEAQGAEFKATEADWRAGYLTLVSNVAALYFRIRQFDELSDQHMQTLERNHRILLIFDAMYQEGLIPKTQLLQQQAEIDRLENELLEFGRLRLVAENGLATLVGTPAGMLKVPKAHLRKATHLVEVPAGLPSQLLARRPDILAAEYRVLQSHNLTGQARLAKLPSISLTGRAGTAAFTAGDLFGAVTTGLTSALSFPIFDPNVQARIKLTEAQTKVDEEVYRRTVITAFEDVENSLTNLSSHKQQREKLIQRQEKLSVVSDQINAQLDEGMVSQLEVFEIERTLLDAEQQLLVNHWLILLDTVTLYKSLGGGWPGELVGRSDSSEL
ncbi:MAG: efflux transporter outer membrane subunit [Gammaproteobacteria bacterium]